MAAEPILRAPRPEIEPASMTSGAGWPKAPCAAASISALRNADLLFMEFASRCHRPGRRIAGYHGKMKHRVIGHEIDLGGFELYLLPVGGAFRPGFLSQRQVYAVHLLVIPIVGNRFIRHAVLDAPAERANFEKIIRVEIDVNQIRSEEHTSELQSL